MNIQKVTSRLGEGKKKKRQHYTALQWWFYFSPEGGECWIIVQKEQWQQSSSGEQWKSIMGFPSHAIRVEQGFWQTHETTNGFGGNIFHSTSPSASAPSTALTSVSVRGNPAQPTHYRGRRKGQRRQDLGFREHSAHPCRALGFTLHLQGLTTDSAAPPLPAEQQSLKHWVKAGEALKRPLRWLKGQGKTSSLTSALWVQLLVGLARSPLIKVHKVQCTEGVQ